MNARDHFTILEKEGQQKPKRSASGSFSVTNTMGTIEIKTTCCAIIEKTAMEVAVDFRKWANTDGIRTENKRTTAARITVVKLEASESDGMCWEFIPTNLPSLTQISTTHGAFRPKRKAGIIG